MPLRKKIKRTAQSQEEVEKLRQCNACPSHFEKCGLDTVYRKNNLCFELAGLMAGEFDDVKKEEIFDLFAKNMQKFYTASSFGWLPRRKKRELFSPTSHYILVYYNEKIVAYVHFQFCWDDDDEPRNVICYIYELQIEAFYQGLGLGKFLMGQMLIICRHWHIQTLTLTCFKANTSAMSFYTKLGYTPDNSSPSKFGIDVDYEILSMQLNEVE